MKIKPTEPDLRTIFGRIKDKSLDLQPDFQRAEVWKLPKKRLLIDTILREWQVPPIHVIFDEEMCVQEVLDGQQRLCAIRDFMEDEFKINGDIEPIDDEIKLLHNLTYSDLPAKVKNRFDRYAIRIFEITDYNQGEPGELFNRLNESLKLTSAEKRNAYVGKLRSQMKYLVKYLDDNGIDSSFLGFSNQRLAYHDLFIKLCFLVESNSLLAKYTEKNLNDRARDDKPFEDKVIASVKYSIETLGDIKTQLENSNKTVHITKASIFSWLFFFSNIAFNNDNPDKSLFIKTFESLEVARFNRKYKNTFQLSLFDVADSDIGVLLDVFNERSTSRVMTSASLSIRDLIINLCYLNYSENQCLLSSSKKESIYKFLDTLSILDIKTCLDDYVEELLWEDLV